MKLKIEFQMDNSAFWTEDEQFEPGEAVRILRDICDKVKHHDPVDLNFIGAIMDSNGNKVGRWGITDN